MSKLLLFGASEDLRRSQSPSNPKSAPKQSQSPQPQAQGIASVAIPPVAAQPVPETANSVLLRAPQPTPDETCSHFQEPFSLSSLEDNFGPTAGEQVVAPIRFVAFALQSQGGGQ